MLEINVIISLIISLISTIAFLTDRGLKIRKTLKEISNDDTDIRWTKVFLVDD